MFVNYDPHMIFFLSSTTRKSLCMDQFKAFKMTLFSKSFSSIISWSSVAISLALFVYSFIADRENFQILAGASALIAIVGIGSVFIYNSQQLSKKKNIMISIYEKWHKTFDVPALNKTKKQNNKILESNVKVEWGKKNSIQALSFRGFSDDITPSIVEEFIEDLNKLNSDTDGTFSVKLEEVSADGSLYAQKVDKDSTENRIFDARLKMAKIIIETVGEDYGKIPQIQFSEAFETGARPVFNSVMIQGDSSLLSRKQEINIANKITQLFPIPDDKAWGIQTISSSVFSFKVMNKNDQRSENIGIYDKFLMKAFDASCKKAEVESEIEEITVVSVKEDSPEEFYIKVSNPESLNDSNVVSIVKYMAIILKNKYKGNWRASNELAENGSILFKDFE